MAFNKEVKYVLNLSLPIIIEMLIYTLMSIADIMMIGNYGGNTAVSVVGISTEIITTTIDIFIAVGMATGITALVAQRVGAKDSIGASKYASAGIFLGIITTIIIFFVILFNSKKLLMFTGTSENIVNPADIFTRLSIIAAFFNMITILLCGVLRGSGDTVSPLKISAVIAFLKITADWMLIFGHVVKAYGIIGAAYASIMAQITGMVFAVYILLFKDKQYIKARYLIMPDKATLLKLLKISVPSSLEDGVFNISRLLCTFMIMQLGNMAFAANEIANTIEGISIMPGIGFGMAATTLVGMKTGEKNFKIAREYTYICAVYSVCIMSAFSIVFLIFPVFLSDLFFGTAEKEVINLTAACIFIGAFEQPSIAISHCFAGALKGAGDAKSPFFISLITSWLIRLPLIFWFIYLKKASVIYVWWITIFQWTIDGLLMYVCFRKKLKK